MNSLDTHFMEQNNNVLPVSRNFSNLALYQTDQIIPTTQLKNEQEDDLNRFLISIQQVISNFKPYSALNIESIQFAEQNSKLAKPMKPRAKLTGAVVNIQGNISIIPEIIQKFHQFVDQYASNMRLRSIQQQAPQAVVLKVDETIKTLNEKMKTLMKQSNTRVSILKRFSGASDRKLMVTHLKQQNFFQSRGSNHPSWFPGCYVIFPKCNKFWHPTNDEFPKILLNAWRKMEPIIDID